MTQPQPNSAPSPQMTLEEAIQILQNAPTEYQFAVQRGDKWWPTRDIAEGIGISTLRLNNWIKADPTLFPNAYAIPGGFNVTRTEMLLFVARFYLNKGIWGVNSRQDAAG
jgi:hypothetical protein